MNEIKRLTNFVLRKLINEKGQVLLMQLRTNLAFIVNWKEMQLSTNPNYQVKRAVQYHNHDYFEALTLHMKTTKLHNFP